LNQSQLASGIYSIRQAAGLVGVPAARLRGWVTGYHDMKGTPLIESELSPLSHRVAITFVNLIEARFIDAFSKYGIKVRSIRSMADEAKRFLRHPHPFATEMIFQTDGKKIFIQAAEQTGDPKLYDLKGKNWGIYHVLSRELQKGVRYSSAGLAASWYPKKEIAPRVVVNPKVAFGQPTLQESGVPTAALIEAFTAEGEDYKSVARWFDLPVDQVKEAVRFELQLATMH
jgi:uncharacterized protein (DUF433 family)